MVSHVNFLTVKISSFTQMMGDRTCRFKSSFITPTPDLKNCVYLNKPHEAILGIMNELDRKLPLEWQQVWFLEKFYAQSLRRRTITLFNDHSNPSSATGFVFKIPILKNLNL